MKYNTQYAKYIVVLGVVVLFGYALFMTQPHITSRAPKPVPYPSISAGTKLIIKGEVICLSHQNSSGPQTMECAYGIRDHSGIEYGLADEKMQYISTLPLQQDLEISGTYTYNQNDRYKAQGTIYIESVNLNP